MFALDLDFGLIVVIYRTMRGVFWNVRGIGQDHKKRYVREMIIDQKLDFIGLSETIKQDFTKNELHNLCGGRNFQWSWNPPRGMLGGS